MKEIVVEIKEVPEKTMYMTQHLGDGSLGKIKFDASFALPNMSLIVDVGGKRLMVDSQALLASIVNYYKENLMKKK